MKKIYKTQKIITTVIVVIILPFLIGCTERFDIDTDNSEPTLVVYGVLTNEYKRQMIRLTRSAPYFDQNRSQPVSDAEVTINSSDNNVYIFREEPEYPGYYISERYWHAKSEVTYNLSINVDFNGDGIVDNYEASTQIQSPIILDSISITPLVIMGHNNYSLNVYGQDSVEEDYYLFHLAVNDTLVTSKVTKYITADDMLFNGQYIDGLTIQYLDDISEWGNDSDEDRRNTIYIKHGDRIDVFTSKIEKGYFDFISECNQEKGGENPLFGGPASNITTNISNGGVGFFTGLFPSRTTTYVGDFY